MNVISENLARVQNRVSAALVQNGMLDTEFGPKIVAVSKRQPKDKINQCLQAGHRVFGENKVAEASERWAAFKKAYTDIKLHLIGPLQTNKARDAIQLFDVIEVVDREKLAKVLQKEKEKFNKNIEFMVQVNTGEEAQKSGVLPTEADAFINFCIGECQLDVVGLMCIPPISEEASMHFALLREIAKRNKIRQLSMGMSNDFETAVAFGATSVRVGSAIFGERIK